MAFETSRISPGCRIHSGAAETEDRERRVDPLGMTSAERRKYTSKFLRDILRHRPDAVGLEVGSPG